MNRRVTDIAASVRQLLTNYAKETGRPFQEVLEYFAMERFLYRLAQSPHADRFILKGALMFTAWGAPASRATKDIDLLARSDNAVEVIESSMREVCQQTVEPDGLIFGAATVKGTIIKEGAEYPGVRITFPAKLQNARVSMQVDVGFGDVVTPKPVKTHYPTILSFAAPILLGYTRETVVAEKFEAMVRLGLLNSRMKDFFDIWLLTRQFDFSGELLANAIEATFKNRKTEIPEMPTALTNQFFDDTNKQKQWTSFIRKSRLSNVPSRLSEITGVIGSFILPISTAIREQQHFKKKWSAPGPWE